MFRSILGRSIIGGLGGDGEVRRRDQGQKGLCPYDQERTSSGNVNDKGDTYFVRRGCRNVSTARASIDYPEGTGGLDFVVPPRVSSEKLFSMKH